MSKKVNKKNDNAYKTSPLGREVKKISNVEDFNERLVENNEEGIINIIGSFTASDNKINYITIERGNMLFVNFRMNVEYMKDEIKDNLKTKEDLFSHINEQNKKTIGIKVFLAKETDESFIVSINAEYILNSKNSDYSFAPRAVNVLSIVPGFLKINKSDE